MRRKKEEILKEEIKRLLDEYLENATKEELTMFVGLLQGCIAIKKIGSPPILEDGT